LFVNYYKKITKIVEDLKKNNIFCNIGFEFEFYNISKNPNEDWITKIDQNIYKIDNELGELQYEISSIENYDPINACKELDKLKNILLDLESENFITSFESKPFDNQPASAIHFNIHLSDNNNNNLLFKNEDILQYTIGGILYKLNKYIKYYTPNNRRFLNPTIHTPTRVSWGGDNRSTAIRIPSNQENNFRIEFRITGSDANPYAAIYALINSMRIGINKQIPPYHNKIFGNASDDQYLHSPYFLKKIKSKYIK